MNTETAHKNFPVGSTWLMPCRVIAHAFPEPDDYDPRPVVFAPFGDNVAHIFPKAYFLDDLKPLEEKRFPISSTSEQLSNGKTRVSWFVHNENGGVLASFVATPGGGLTPARARAEAVRLSETLKQQKKYA